MIKDKMNFLFQHEIYILYLFLKLFPFFKIILIIYNLLLIYFTKLISTIIKVGHSSGAREIKPTEI